MRITDVMTKWIVSLVIAVAGFGCLADKISVDPNQAVIVLPAAINPVAGVAKSHNTAAEELRKHLKLITGVDIPIFKDGDVPAGKYPFYIQKTPADDKKTIVSQESRWVVTPKAAYFYGDTQGYGTGAQYAVYSFLEDQLGVKWIEPGDEGIVCPKMASLKLNVGSFNWIPKLMFRSIRQGNARIAKKMSKPRGEYAKFADFQPSLEEHNQFAEDVMLWKKRMKMGGRRPGGGHAFWNWWKKYGKTHPEYFALNKFGKRKPVPLPKVSQTEQFVKICASNPAVADQIIADWRPRSKIRRFVNAGMNDGTENFCECEKCKKLDVRLKGERFADDLTDRYVYLANAVARRARKIRPDAMVSMYAYLTTLHPPRKTRVEPNVVVQVVPYVIPLETEVTEKILGGWKDAGATMLALRPNYHCKYMTGCIPIGVEKQMFDVFQNAVKNGCVSADYDSLTNNWPITGITDFILASAMADPSKSFDHWKNQYYSAFGAGSKDVGGYFDYWRKELWNKRLLPNIQKICDKGGAGDFTRGLFWSMGDYYKLSDFENAAAFLKVALMKKLTKVERSRVEELQLANEHARLTFQAITAQPADKSEFAKKLLAFRKKNKKDLPLQWMGVFYMELANGDLAGMKLSKTMKGYLKPWIKTDLFWRFTLDPKDVGLKEKWQELTWSQTTGWDKLRTDRFWERQFAFDEKNTLSKPVADIIGRYDGIGWYTTRIEIPSEWKDRKIYLRFGAVDESAWVYLNGQYAGEHLYKLKNDWKTPFEIRIDKLIDWSKEKQQITVRVEDKGGVGGIWRTVWVVSKK